MPELHGHACFEAGVSQHVHVVSDTTKGPAESVTYGAGRQPEPQRRKQPG